jgi:hypothetical protein
MARGARDDDECGKPRAARRSLPASRRDQTHLRNSTFDVKKPRHTHMPGTISFAGGQSAVTGFGLLKSPAAELPVWPFANVAPGRKMN